MLSLRCALVVGGLPMIEQQVFLSKKPHVVVATPGRLLDHLEATKVGAHRPSWARCLLRPLHMAVLTDLFTRVSRFTHYNI